MTRRAWLLGVAAAALGGCATLPVPPGDTTWQEHLAALQRIERWQLRGRMAVRAEEQGGNVKLYWHQGRTAFDIRITSALGQGGVRIQGERDDGVVMRFADGREYRADDPDTLVRAHLDYPVPVEELRFWVLGRPQPDLAHELTLDQHGRLGSLAQSGWDAQFLDYRRVEAFFLPRKIVLRKHPLTVRLVVDSWESL